MKSDHVGTQLYFEKNFEANTRNTSYKEVFQECVPAYFWFTNGLRRLAVKSFAKLNFFCQMALECWHYNSDNQEASFK